MAYADQKAGSGRIVAIIIVAAVHAVLGYFLVSGLAYQYVKQVSEELNTFDVQEPPPPPPEEEPPPPPPDTPQVQPPPVVTPPPLVRTNTPPPVVIQSVNTPPPSIVTTMIAAPPVPAAPVAPPVPAPPKVSKKAGPKGNPGSWFSNDDYPPAARRAEAEGRVSVSVTVGTNGRVTACRVTSSSGNSDLDNTTCRLAERRGRFSPALDDAGNPIQATYSLPGIRWQLED
ncbi:energy transducer TonB [Sphingomonas qomolangmaensis]|uniref:TonB family protein n=1 Tax=Sphingomonas qomolangmaensis TaxID=2918765 RepID=A0ABY5L715_9SPHN|nr:TonB family protein [Sphingomonas qomolangmaensis]